MTDLNLIPHLIFPFQQVSAEMWRHISVQVGVSFVSPPPRRSQLGVVTHVLAVHSRLRARQPNISVVRCNSRTMIKKLKTDFY